MLRCLFQTIALLTAQLCVYIGVSVIFLWLCESNHVLWFVATLVIVVIGATLVSRRARRRITKKLDVATSPIPWTPTSQQEIIRHSLDILKVPSVLAQLVCEYADDSTGLLSGRRLPFYTKISDETECDYVDLWYEKQTRQWIVLCEDNSAKVFDLEFHVVADDLLEWDDSDDDDYETKKFHKLWSCRENNGGELVIYVQTTRKEIGVFSLDDAFSNDFSFIRWFAVDSPEAKAIAKKPDHSEVSVYRDKHTQSLCVSVSDIFAFELAKRSEFPMFDTVKKVVLGISSTRATMAIITDDPSCIHVFSDVPFTLTE